MCDYLLEPVARLYF